MIDREGKKHYVYHSKPGQLPKGYRATLSLRKVGEDKYTVGISVCSPHDQFVKKLGTKKATGRAMKKEAETFVVENRNEYVSSVFENLSGQIKRGRINPHH